MCEDAWSRILDNDAKIGGPQLNIVHRASGVHNTRSVGDGRDGRYEQK